MINTFLSFFRNPPPKPTEVQVPVYPPYYEVIDREGNQIACISGAHHDLAPNAQFTPAPVMQKCFDRATKLFVEVNKESAKQELRRRMIQQGISSQSIDEHFQQVESEANGIDKEWEDLAKAESKPIKGLESPRDALK